MRTYLKFTSKGLLVSLALFFAGGQVQVTGQSWGEQTSGTTEDLNAIDFYQSNGVVAGNNGTIIQTDDGVDWDPQTTNTTVNLYDVALIHDGAGLHGYAIGESGTVSTWEEGDPDWQSTQITAEPLYGLYAWDEESLILTGGDGAVMRTSDGGDTWTSINPGTTEPLRDVHFITNSDGYIVGGSAGNAVILESFNGGGNWSASSHNASEQLNALHFVNDSLGIAVGEENIAAITRDGGSTWEEETILGGLLASVNFLDVTSHADVIYITAEDGSVIVSEDRGHSWEEIETDVSEDLTGMAFANPSYITGTGGVILSSCPEAAFSSSEGEEACVNTTFDFTNESEDGINYTWTVDDDTVGTSEDLSYTFENDGSFEVTLVAENETCPDEYSMDITIHPAPVVDLGPDTSIQEDETYELDAGPDGQTYSWFRDGVNTGHSNQTFEVGEAGEYVAQVTNEEGCVNSDTVQVDVVTSILVKKSDIRNVEIYPNPATDYVNIEFVSPGEASVKLYDMLGNEVVNGNISGAGQINDRIALHGLSEGIYLLEIETSTDSFSRRLVVE